MTSSYGQNGIFLVQKGFASKEGQRTTTVDTGWTAHYNPLTAGKSGPPPILRSVITRNSLYPKIWAQSQRGEVKRSEVFRDHHRRQKKQKKSAHTIKSRDESRAEYVRTSIIRAAGAIHQTRTSVTPCKQNRINSESSLFPPSINPWTKGANTRSNVRKAFQNQSPHHFLLRSERKRIPKNLVRLYFESAKKLLVPYA